MQQSRLVRFLRNGASALALATLVAVSPLTAQEAATDQALVENEAARDGVVAAWGLDPTDVQPDPAIRYGRLDNGMRYAIRPFGPVETAAAIRMHVDFGSLNEAEDERGLAHFIEHMVFNGSTNVPEGEMIPILERLGLAFGPDTNATTDFTETIYKLDIASATEERIDKSLFLMRETASEVLFNPAAVERERGVILSERRSRDDVNLRNAVDQIDFLVPDTLYSKRLPIGTTEVLTTAPADRLKALYHRYYRPENTTLVVVGAVDPDTIEAKIKAQFGDWVGTGPAGTKPDIGSIDIERPAATETFIDPAVPNAIQIAVMRPYTDPMDTIDFRFNEQLERISFGMMNGRLQRLTQQADSVIINGQAITTEFEGASKYSVIFATTRDGAWAQGLALAEQELRKALEFGFTQGELDRAMVNFEEAYRQYADQANARAASEIADGIVSNAADNDLNTDPQWRFDLFQEFKPRLTLDKMNAAFRALWAGSPPLVHVSAKDLPGGSEAVAAAFGASTQIAVTPPEEVEVAEFAYDSFGDKPGRVVSDKMIKDFGIRTVRFANNVLLNIKDIDVEPGSVEFTITMDGGTFSLPGSQIGNNVFFNVSGAGMGTVQHSAQDFEDILAGKFTIIGLTAGDTVFSAAGPTTAENLPLQMKVSAAYFSDNGFRPEAQARWDGLLDVVYDQLLANPAVVFQLNGAGELTQNDKRFFLPSREEMGAVSQESFRKAFLANAADAAIEIGIAGDVDPDYAIRAVAQTFGALPKRQKNFRSYDEQRIVPVKETFSPVTLFHTGQPDQAVAATMWLTADDSSHREVVGMSLLREVVSLKALMVLREELGATYTPEAASEMSNTFDDFGYFYVSAVVDPTDVDKALAAIPSIIADIREEGVDKDLFNRARQPLLEQSAAIDRGNAYWMSLASRAQSEPEGLERARNYDDILESLTPAELQQLAQKYLIPERQMDVRVISNKPVAPAPE